MVSLLHHLQHIIGALSMAVGSGKYVVLVLAHHGSPKDYLMVFLLQSQHSLTLVTLSRGASKKDYKRSFWDFFNLKCFFLPYPHHSSLCSSPLPNVCVSLALGGWKHC